MEVAEEKPTAVAAGEDFAIVETVDAAVAACVTFCYH